MFSSSKGLWSFSLRIDAEFSVYPFSQLIKKGEMSNAQSFTTLIQRTMINNMYI